MGFVNARFAIYCAVGIACMSVFIPIIFKSRKPTTFSKSISKDDNNDMAENNDVPPAPVPPLSVHDKPKKEHFNQKPTQKKKSWTATFLPFYGIGIVFYIMYVFLKMMSTKRRQVGEKKKQSYLHASSKQKGRAKISHYELQQLEQKLIETEKNLEKILCQANNVVKVTKNITDDKDDLENEIHQQPTSTYAERERKLST